MKHILFISYDGMTDPLGQSQVIPYLKGLTTYGYRFTILSCEKPERFNTYKNKIIQTLRFLPIEWVPLKYHKVPPVLSAIYDLRMLKKKAAQLHQSDPFDMVHTRAGTPALVGQWMKRKYGVKFLNDIRDFFADSRVDSGSWNKKNLLYNMVYQYFKRKEEEQLTENDGVICLTHAAENIIKQNMHLKTGTPVEVIPCSVDTELFNPEKINEGFRSQLKKEMNIREDDFIISYLGSVGGWYLTDEMMRFFKMLIARIPNARFLFITPHGQEEIFRHARKSNISPDKIMVRHANREEVPLFLSLSHYSLFFIKPCFSKQASSPTKHAEIMAMGIPVISNAGVGDIQEIINQSQSGIVLDDLDESNWDKAINHLSSKIFNKQKIRNAAIDFYDLNKAVRKYRDVYRLIIG